MVLVLLSKDKTNVNNDNDKCTQKLIVQVIRNIRGNFDFEDDDF